MGLFSSFKKIGSSANGILDSTQSKMIKAGGSVQGVAGIVGRITDTLLSGADSSFLKNTGITTSRVPASLLDLNRFANAISGRQYSANITPVRKLRGKQLGDLQFPEDLGEYFISFKFMKYERPNPMEPAKEVDISMVYLPVPTNLSESHSLDWATVNQGILGTIVNQLDARGDELTKEKVQKLLQDPSIGNIDPSNIVNILSTIGLSISGEQFAGLLQQTAGAVPNPNLSVMFRGPTLGSHSFYWRFHPHNALESEKLKAVINEFRKAMLPNVRGENLGPNILGYPKMVQIEIHPKEAQEAMHKLFKKMVISNININYAPNGIPSFFAGTKAPTVIDFQVDLQDLEYYLSEDFGGESTSEVIDFNSISRDFIGDELTNDIREAGDVFTDSFSDFFGGESE